VLPQDPLLKKRIFPPEVLDAQLFVFFIAILLYSLQNQCAAITQKMLSQYDNQQILRLEPVLFQQEVAWISKM
jgi:hypothetical protein